MDITAAMGPMFNRITAPAPTIRCTIIGVRILMLIPIRVKRVQEYTTTRIIIHQALIQVISIDQIHYFKRTICLNRIHYSING